MKENKDVAKGWILKAESDIENLTTMMEMGKALDAADEKAFKEFILRELEKAC